ncbi:complex I subunit 4 family protein [Brasilonema bromeliae]|uniref:NADH-quinone oxidoreductase subunit M n=1 Tax=Brasilonema bromeliae SPC951 TaxID=385972 RepID=A0ABX1PCC7_9CYAN|nr:NADH-quinone oxidoreductase subunit M [Brasilonema bromeliae]NMG22137.1 NADH-quinone oxidoreductase subunit M [Brasilonema bromeliae SPC951]
MTDAVWFSLIVFVPLVGAILCAGLPRGSDDAARWITLGASLVVFALAAALLVVGPKGAEDAFRPGVGTIQHVVTLEWIPSFGVYYFLGVDGISFWLLLMTTFVSVLAAAASWSIDKNVQSYSALFLILLTGMVGVFLALDLLLFYVFFELVLLPMYFLIGVWGGPRKEYAAIKFFIYTLFGSALILIAVLMLYFASDLTKLTDDQLRAAHLPADAVAQIAANRIDGPPVRTFNIVALQTLARETDVFRAAPLFWGQTLEWWAFVLLTIGFLVKVPSVPFHTWLPDAHVEAPTAISMLLAGVLLKMGGYGLIRIALPICPIAAQVMGPVLAGLGAVSIVYGALAALAQTDFKRLVAYSSVSHMGYVLLGLSLWASGPDAALVDSWSMGLSGATYQMIAHGLTSAGMFFIVGVLYDRLHHRDLNRFGGLAGEMPVGAGMAAVVFFASLGLPTLCGFIGEVFVLLSTWSRSPVAAAIGAVTTIFTAGYILTALQRVFYGVKPEGIEREPVADVTPREIAVLAPIVAFSVVFGVLPQLVFRYVEPATTHIAREVVAAGARPGVLAPIAAARSRPADPPAAVVEVARDAAKGATR